MKIKLVSVSTIFLLFFLPFCCFGQLNKNDRTNFPQILKVKSLETNFDLEVKWKYQQGDDLAWANPEFDDSTWTDFQINKSPEQQAIAANNNFSWFRIRLKLPIKVFESSEDFEQLYNDIGIALQTKIFLNYQIYANGVLITPQKDILSVSRIEYPWPKIIHIPANLIDNKGNLCLAIRVWFFPEYAVGSGRRAFSEGLFVLGKVPNLEITKENRQIKLLYKTANTFVLSIIFLLISLYHLLLYIRLGTEKDYLRYSLCVFFYSMQVFAGTFFWNSLALDSHNNIILALFIFNKLTSVFLIEFLWNFLGKPISKWVRAFQLLNLINILIFLFLPFLLMLRIETLTYAPLSILFLVMIIKLIGVESWRGNSEAKVLLLGSLSYFVVFLIQIKLPYNIIQWAFAFNIVLMATLVANRFARVYKELNILNRDLEKKVAERTNEISEKNKALQDRVKEIADKNQELIESNRDAEKLNKEKITLLSQTHKAEQEANKTKSQFLANMSHEIRTPLNGIIAISQLLISSSLNKEQEELIEIVRTSGNNLLVIINEILDFSKIEAGKLELEFIGCDVREIIQQSIQLLALQAKDKGLKLDYSINKDTRTFLISDVTRLQQILVNLISNAVKFTNKGEVSISLSNTKKTDKIYEFHFQVKDTGIGIAPKQINKLFQPFSQVDASTTRKYGGTGLGLVISKRLSELLGGKMWVESTLGKGSTFHFTIMAEVVNDDEIQKIQSIRNKNLNIDSIVKDFPLEILVAEDNLINQQIALKVLKKIGYQADIASNGLEVLNKLEQKQYDLILMDVQMPEMDGLEATRQICKLYSKEKRPRIIAVTAGAMEANRQQCLEAGMDGFSTKPIDIVKLNQILSQYQNLKTSIVKTEKTILVEDLVRATNLLTSELREEIAKETLVKERSELPQKKLSEPVLDYSQLEVLISLQDEDEPNLVAELIDNFINSSKERIDKLSNAVNQNDLKTIQIIAHSLVSSSGYLGASKLVILSRQLEQLAVNEQISEIKSLFASFLIEFEKACSALKIEQEKITLEKQQTNSIKK
ncbi:MAG: ATP-binding protein [Blastocatellia bacterium]